MGPMLLQLLRETPFYLLWPLPRSSFLAYLHQTPAASCRSPAGQLCVLMPRLAAALWFQLPYVNPALAFHHPLQDTLKSNGHVTLQLLHTLLLVHTMCATPAYT